MASLARLSLDEDEFVHSIQILNRHGLLVQNLYQRHKLILEKVVITAFEMHIKLAKISFIFS